MLQGRLCTASRGRGWVEARGHGGADKELRVMWGGCLGAWCVSGTSKRLQKL